MAENLKKILDAHVNWLRMEGGARADLRGAYLRGAYLRGANLPSPPEMLLASWGALSDELTRDLMTYDAACHPDPSAFSRWAAGGACPYDDVRVKRAAHFDQDPSLWDPTAPLVRPYDLMVRESCRDSDFHEPQNGTTE